MRLNFASPSFLGHCRLAMTLALSLVAASASAQCSGLEIGVPPDSANSSGSVFDGEALGQTFFAERTVVQSITVWRVAYEGNFVSGMRVFVMPTDSLGQPDFLNMIASGPSVFHTDGDGVHPTPFEFVFDPPLQLPKVGEYEFAVQADPCWGIWDILDVNITRRAHDTYPGGSMWLHSRWTDLPCRLRGWPTRYPVGDLCFSVRFCDAATPVKRTSWGKLKSIYRRSGSVGP